MLRRKKILRFTPRETLRTRLLQFRLLYVGQHFGRVHRKQPLANHGPEKSRRKRPNWPNLEPNCAAHSGCFPGESAQKSALI
jgi:hypothetical protein